MWPPGLTTRISSSRPLAGTCPTVKTPTLTAAPKLLVSYARASPMTIWSIALISPGLPRLSQHAAGEVHGDDGAVALLPEHLANEARSRAGVEDAGIGGHVLREDADSQLWR